MFGHDDNDEHKKDDSNQPGFVAPTVNANDDNPGLGDESAHHANGGSQPDNNSSNGFIMDPVVPAAPAPAVTTPAPTAATGSDDLIRIKQEALQQLSPLVGHLDQNPEEKFRTLMMMIQASDDQTKLNEAYDAAKAITDEKIRAQALLDVVNEINYFTQQHK